MPSLDSQTLLLALKAKMPNARVMDGALSADEKLTALANHKKYDNSGYKFMRSRLDRR